MPTRAHCKWLIYMGQDRSGPYCAAGMRAASRGRCTSPENIAMPEAFCDLGRSMSWVSVKLIWCGRKCVATAECCRQ